MQKHCNPHPPKYLPLPFFDHAKHPGSCALENALLFVKIHGFNFE